MELLNFIVLQSNTRQKHVTYSVSGMVLLPLDKTVPVIVSGQGCIGVGIVKQLTIRSTGTDIEFELTTGISDTEKSAYYNLYRNQVSSSTADKFESTDAIIPGAMTNLSGRSNKKKERERIPWDYSGENDYRADRASRRGRSLSELLDED